MVKKLRALKRAEDSENKRYIKIIKNKIKIEKLRDTLELQKHNIEEEIMKIQNNNPDLNISWKQIFKEFNIK